MPKPESLASWREAVLTRDAHRCQLGPRLCFGPLAAHHVVLLSRDRTRRADVDNGATLCRAHHEWVHSHPVEARDIHGLMGHHWDVVKGGRVVFREDEPA